MNHDINLKFEDINIINVIPIEIMEKPWICIAYEEKNLNDYMHFAFLYKENYTYGTNLLNDITTFFSNTIPLLRIHSECFFGDVVNSSLCDCGEQLNESIKMIINKKAGILLYLRQEGRGIGMRAKLACLAIQEGYYKGNKTSCGCSSDNANLLMGFKVDERNYKKLLIVLKLMNIRNVELISGNPEKKQILQELGINVSNILDINRKPINLASRKAKELYEKESRNYYYKNIKIKEEENL